MRVSRSPSGSFMRRLPLPARLRHAGDHPLACKLAQHVSAQLELAVIAASAAGQLAPVAHARGRRVARQLRQLETCRKALLAGLVQIARDAFQLLALGGILRHQLLAAVVLVDRTRLGHAVPPTPVRSRLAEWEIEAAQ